MVTPSQDFRTLASAAADERQLRISAFKSKVASLHATSKVYNITSDISLNTLDSSVANTSISASIESRSADGVARNAAATVAKSAAVLSAMAATPERRGPKDETNPFADNDDDDDYDGKAAGQMMGRTERTSAPKKTTNPFWDDSDESEEDDEEDYDSSVCSNSVPSTSRRNTNDSQDEEDDSFTGLMQAFRRKKEASQNPFGDEDSTKEDEKEVIGKNNDVRSDQPKLSLEKKAGVTAASNRPGVIARDTSKQSTGARSGTSSNTFSTFDGFSIESVQEEDEEDDNEPKGRGISRAEESVAVGRDDREVKTNTTTASEKPLQKRAEQQTRSNPFEDDSIDADKSRKNPFEDDSVDVSSKKESSASKAAKMETKMDDLIQKRQAYNGSKQKNPFSGAYERIMGSASKDDDDAKPFKSVSSAPAKRDALPQPSCSTQKTAQADESNKKNELLRSWTPSSNVEHAEPSVASIATSKIEMARRMRQATSKPGSTPLGDDSVTTAASAPGPNMSVNQPSSKLNNPFLGDDSIAASSAMESTDVDIESMRSGQPSKWTNPFGNDSITTASAAATKKTEIKKSKNKPPMKWPNPFSDGSTAASGPAVSKKKENEPVRKEQLSKPTNPFGDDSVSSSGLSDLKYKTEELIRKRQEINRQHQLDGKMGSESKGATTQQHVEQAASAKASTKAKAEVPSKRWAEQKGSKGLYGDVYVGDTTGSISSFSKDTSVLSSVAPKKNEKPFTWQPPPRRSSNSIAKLYAENAESISRGGLIGQQESESTATEIYLADSNEESEDMDDAAPTPPRRGKSSSDNPFGDLLKLRQRQKMEAKRKLTQSVGSMNLESSSNEDNSMSSNSQSTSSIKRFPTVYCGDSDNGNDSLDGALFSDLKKALSKIQSVDYEESIMDEEEKEHEQDEAVEEEEDDDDASSSLATGIKSPVKVVNKEETSCVVSSMKDTNENYDAGSDFNDDPFDDDIDSISSVPKSPAPIVTDSNADKGAIKTASPVPDRNVPSERHAERGMSAVSQVHLLGQGSSDTSTDSSSPTTRRQKEQEISEVASKAIEEAKRELDTEEEGVIQDGNSDGSTTVTCSNSHKTDYIKEHRDHRSDSTLTPPKKDVVMNDNDGSISTKDSILGKTINVANADLVAERIYLESLRAQVLAELKVHVADEEIRLALDARLQAIQAYYKRKATVLSLRKTAAIGAPNTPTPPTPKTPSPLTPSPRSEGSNKEDRDFLKALGDLPKVKPAIVSPENGGLEGEPSPFDSPESNCTSVLPKVKQAIVSPANGGSEWESFPFNSPESNCTSVIPYPQQRQMSRKIAFQRVQGTLDNAIKEAQNAPKANDEEEEHKSDLFFPIVKHGHEEEKVPEDEEDEDALYNRQSTDTPIPLHIFTKDTFWDDEDDPSNVIITPHSTSPGTNYSLGGGVVGIIERHQPTRADTIHNAWDFYSSINTLIFDSRVYDYQFQVLQEDPLYPYLNSLMGIADMGEDGYSNEHKRIAQKVKKEYSTMSPHRICHSLVEEGEEALPELKAICAYIGKKLGMQTMAIGPMKKTSEALLKSERKYGGDPLLVTDYCRASLFAKDIASLLALIEIVLSKYAGIVRRIKLSSLKSDHVPLVGGYRDCKINLDIAGHICEIQVHLIPMWLIKEGKGYSHYKKCCEHNVDMSSFDISKTLSGLEREDLVDLIKVGENATKKVPITSLQQYNETQIRDYFALASLYIYHGSPAKAEYILRRTVKLRSESNNFGPYHPETLLHLELLRKSLKYQHKYKSASSVKSQINKIKKMQRSKGKTEPENLSDLCTNDQCGALDYVCDMILDPSKRDRAEEKRRADNVEESRALWLNVRRSYF